VAYDARELPAMIGKSTSELAQDLRREVVHRDEMILHELTSD
jgi:glutamate 5-kinase